MAEDEFQEIHDVEDIVEPEESLEPGTAPPQEPGEGVPWGAILLLFWAVVLIVFSVQNAEATSVDFLGWTWEMPVAVLVMVTALVTLVIAMIGSVVYRRRRRKQRQMKAAAKSDE